jgi:hypothetical protein
MHSYDIAGPCFAAVPKISALSSRKFCIGTEKPGQKKSDVHDLESRSANGRNADPPDTQVNTQELSAGRMAPHQSGADRSAGRSNKHC